MRYLFLYMLLTAYYSYGQKGFSKIDNSGSISSDYAIVRSNDPNNIYFECKQYAVWKYDGTTLSEVINSNFSYESQLIILNDTIYFASNHTGTPYGSELYKCHSGNTTPQLIKDLNPGTNGSSPRFLTVLNNKIYFVGDSGMSSQYVFLKEYNPATGTCRNLCSAKLIYYYTLQEMIVYNNNLYITMYDSVYGNELFKIDTISGAKTLVFNSYPGNTISDPLPKGFTVINNNLYFAAYNDSFGRELYKYDGINTPVRLTDLPVAKKGNIICESINALCARDKYIYLQAKDDLNEIYYLYKYDTLSGNLYNIKALNRFNTTTRELFNYHNNIYLSTTNNGELTICKTNDSLKQMSVIHPFLEIRDPKGFTILNNKMYFIGRDSSGYNALWCFDDSVLLVKNAESRLAATIYPNPAHDMATIELNLKEPQRLKISVTNTQGAEVFSIPIQQYAQSKHNITIPMQPLSSGTYFYYITDADGKIQLSGKLIKE